MLTWQVGDVRITQIVELTTASLGPYLLPQATPEMLDAIDWLAPFVDAQQRIVLSIHALVLETRGSMPRGRYVYRQRQGAHAIRAGITCRDAFSRTSSSADSRRIASTPCLCTHMHVDHVGWNTRLVDGRWEPTFAKARHLFAEKEWQHWSREPQEYGPVIEDSVQPIFDRGLADLVSESHRVSDEIRLEPTPGHTPGHVSVHITSRGEEAVITGDMIHHPCQIAHPAGRARPTSIQFGAATTRARSLERYADRPVLIIGTHFAAPTAGRIVRDGDSYRLDY